MAGFSRRDFLKAISLTGTAAAFGCGQEPFQQLIPPVTTPEDVVPGEATWYATTCRECPAGCGMLAKNRDGRVIKVEGNPLHPVNGGETWGKLCARGQAAVQGVYNPDRFRGPMRQTADGRISPVTWKEGESFLVKKLQDLAGRGRGEKVVFVSSLVTGARKELLDHWMRVLGSRNVILYEPMAYEALRKANEVVFGQDEIPTYHLDQTDFLISFGANFLETWLSNILYARQFATFHAVNGGKKNFFVFVGPRLSMTAANADQWLPVPPGTQSLAALGLLRAILEENPTWLPGERKSFLLSRVRDLPLSTVASRTGVKEETFRALARRFKAARRPLVLAEGLNHGDPQALETAVAANLLCTLSPGTRQTIDFSNPSSLGAVARAEKMRELAEKMDRKEVEVLLFDGANPVFSLPEGWGFEKGMKQVPLVASFSSYPCETTASAHWILPTHTFLESWGDYSPMKNVRGLVQPLMGALWDTRDLGDILISTGRQIAGEKEFPWKNFHQMLREVWRRREGGEKSSPGPMPFWLESLRRGGIWQVRVPGDPLPSGRMDFSFSPAPAAAAGEKKYSLLTYPTIQFFDGRSANRPFLQELPDPVTNVTWGEWIEINPGTAEQLGIRKDDVLILKTPHGTLRAPAYPYPGILSGTLAMPIGQGHKSFGGYAGKRGGNPAQLLSPSPDPATGAIQWFFPEVTVEKEGRSIPLANTDGSRYQHGRNLAQSLSWESHWRTTDQPPAVEMPLPEGFSKKRDFYPPHEHVDYRWAMAVDLDRCIGCGACVAACYAENNVPFVGRKQVLNGREMSWLHIERYLEPEPSSSSPGQVQIRFLPMLCQHCDEAPCEAVCPVFAPQHNPEGINNQVYNRCIGTRFCNQNCPWKIRRFNWYTYTRPEPLPWQLNPDVTVRQKGVMEKCSFCIQRINKARMRARSEGRKLRDQEFTTACAQTCPADALVFGSLMDPESRVSKMVRQSRAYQVLGHLNTKPAVIYLKKITQKL